jgi:predicted metalloprotease
VLSPGDLDEAVSTAIQAGDDTEDTDQHGTPFEKIEQFRRGVLGDYAACQAEFGL